jgi:integrating conjugative element protein (TIGR03757 family)
MFIEARADNVRRIGESSLRHLACVLTVAFYYFASATDALAAEVWVVTDRLHPVKASIDVRIIELDAPARAEADLAAQLPSNRRQAAATVRKRLKSGGADLHRRLAVAYQGVIDAWSLGIAKLPAIVVDRQYVVYGEPNVDRAVSRINEYRSTRP